MIPLKNIQPLSYKRITETWWGCGLLAGHLLGMLRLIPNSNKIIRRIQTG